MTKKKKIIIWFSVALVLISILASFFLRKKSKTEYLTETVKRGVLTREVSATGSMLSKEDLNLNFETGGRIKEIKVYAGKEVAKGDVLATIENDILSSEVEKARLAWEKSIADAGSNSDAIREAEQSVKNAEKYLEEVKKLDDEKEASAQEEVDSAKAYYNDVLAYYQQIVKDNGENSSQAKSAKMTLTAAENSKKTAEKNLAVVKQSSDVNYVSAKGSLDSAKDKLRTIQSEYTLQSRNATVQAAKLSYDQALANLEKSSLKAPVNGLITKINYKPGEVLGTASLNAPFGKMMAKDFLLEVDVPESDIAKIQLGQKAEISFDAIDNEEKFLATVIEIEPAATVIQEVVYYKVKLSLDKFDGRLKEGMSFDANIKIFRKENVLIIPRRALVNDGNSVRILLADGKTVQEKKVEKGSEGDDGLIEIISGLQEGEKVVVAEKNTN